MKYLLTCSLSIVLALAITSCGEKKEAQQESEASSGNSWKEMDEFHMVMAETFHPYKDSSDLQPVKQKASELAAAAEKWSNAPLPEKVDNEDTKAKLQQLKSETAALTDVVQAGDDEKIGSQLTKVHDMFHEIQETWYGGGGHEHGHEH